MQVPNLDIGRHGKIKIRVSIAPGSVCQFLVQKVKGQA